MSLSEILEEVAKLSSAEKQQIVAVINHGIDLNAETTERKKEERLLQTMFKKGMIRNIPNRNNLPRKSRPVLIKGEPISETIIRDRG
jgi:hypothetical protein